MSQKPGAGSRPGLGHCTFELLLSGPACISFNIVCMCVLNTANSKLVLNSVYLITLLLTKWFSQGVMLERASFFVYIYSKNLFKSFCACDEFSQCNATLR